MSTQSPTIHVVLTGGTIDSYYNGTRDTVETLEHSSLPTFFKNLKLYEQLEFTEVCMKDSRALTQDDLEHIVLTIEESPHAQVLVTHGTYTMPDTAKYLKTNLKRRDQTIVFTGSLIPLIGFSPSDAPFNLGYSLAMIQTLDQGIYVCMNGRVFDPQEVAKLLYEGRFISIFSKFDSSSTSGE